MNSIRMSRIISICLYTIIILVAINPFLVLADVKNSDKLFDYAEQNYSQYFRPSGVNSFFIGDYYVRYYPETDTYLGTLYNDVFVYGKVFGGLVKVGRIDDYITVDNPSTSTVKINDINPTEASSGTFVTINGEGFAEDSVVRVDGVEVIPEYVSENQLRFIVPFSISSDNELIPYPEGTIFVGVDNYSITLEITSLPVSILEPGQVLSQNIDSIKERFYQNYSSFQAKLETLLNENTENTDTQQIINDLIYIADLINTLEFPDIAKLRNEIDTQTLKTIEGALLKYLKKSDSSLAKEQNLSMLESFLQEEPDCKSITNGDQWLKCREKLVGELNNLSDVSKVLGSMATVMGAISVNSGITAIPAIGVAALSTAALVSVIIDEINATTDIGRIRHLKLDIEGTSADDKQDNIIKTLNLRIDNYLNNEKSQTIKISHASIGVTEKPDIADIVKNSLSTFINYLPAPITIKNELWKLLFDKVLELVIKENKNISNDNFPIIYKDVSNAFLESYLYGSHLAFPYYSPERGMRLYGPDCRSQLPYHFDSELKIDKEKWIVPDVGDSHNGKDFSIDPLCIYQIQDAYLLPSEQDVKASIKFIVNRFPKLTVTIEDSIKDVSYDDVIPLSERQKCTKELSPCEEYFSNSENINTVKLLAHKTDASMEGNIKWSGIGTENCSGETCAVNLDGSNSAAPNITVSFNCEFNNLEKNLPGTWVYSKSASIEAYPVNLDESHYDFTSIFYFLEDGRWYEKYNDYIYGSIDLDGNHQILYQFWQTIDDQLYVYDDAGFPFTYRAMILGCDENGRLVIDSVSPFNVGYRFYKL